MIPSNTKKLINSELSGMLDILPPFLMVDTFIADFENKTGLSTFNAVKNDWFFCAHLPKEGVMPASLILESMLQTMVLLIYHLVDHGVNRSYITDVNLNLKKSVRPGSMLTNKCVLLACGRGIFKGEVHAYVEDDCVASGIFKYASPSIMPKLNIRNVGDI